MPPTIYNKRGTQQDLSSVNPVLGSGELCLETDTNRIKFGDGVSSWNSLNYAIISVDLTGLQDNNFLVYNSGTLNWEPTNNFTYNEETSTTTIQSENINNNLQLSQSSEVSGGHSPRLTLLRNRGTLDTPLPINSGDFIGNINFRTLDSTDSNDLAAQISVYTGKGLSSYDKVPAQFRIINRTTDGSYSFIYILDDGTFNPTSGAIINDQAKSTAFSATGRSTALQVFNSVTLNDKENASAGLHWSYAVIDPSSSGNSVTGSTAAAYISVPSGTNNTGAIVGDVVYALRNAIGDADNGSLSQVIGQSTVYGHAVFGDATTTSTIFAQGISISPFAGKGTITTAYDLFLGNTIYDSIIDASGTIKEGDGSITNRYGIVQQSADPNVLSGSLTVNNGLSAPTKIYALGTVSGNVSISYDIDKQIQTLTLDGTTTNFIEGSGWPSTTSVDVLLEITVTNTTTVTWTIVDDQYNPFPTFTAGKYLVLLRSMGTTIQGHYIGEKTN